MIENLMDTYKRYPISFSKGKGSWLYDNDGGKYLDFAAGIAVNVLGHGHPEIKKVMHEAIDNVWHVSNLYQIPEQQKLAKKLCDISFADKVFFCNSGAEAVEGAIKTSRKYHIEKGDKDRTEIITFKNAFHGRTLATLAAGANPKHTEGFGPLPSGFVNIELSQKQLEEKISNKTAAVLIEPIQGEGGIRITPKEDLQMIRDLTSKHGVLMILDQVQCGLGRTGDFFSHEWAGIEPDIITLAKGLGAGFPIGAILASTDASSGMVHGSHGSTFGGNPLACSVALKVLEIIDEEKILSNVKSLSEFLLAGINDIIENHKDKITSVRGRGFMLGIKCEVENTLIAETALNNGLLLVPAADNIIRLLPPLNTEKDDIEQFFNLLNITLENLPR